MSCPTNELLTFASMFWLELPFRLGAENGFEESFIFLLEMHSFSRTSWSKTESVIEDLLAFSTRISMSSWIS